MKNILAYAGLMVLLSGCTSTQEGAPVGAAAPMADTPVADAAPAAEAPVGNAFYTDGQASRGRGLFRDNCASCHASSEFAGSSFKRRWQNRAVGDIYEFVLYSMPDDNPGGLPQQTYVDIIAFLLQLNDFPAGETELSTSMDVLKEMIMFDEAAGDGDQ